MNNCIRNQQKNINDEENVLDLSYRICKEPHEHIKVFFRRTFLAYQHNTCRGFLREN